MGKKTYTVAGPLVWEGHAPGESFSAEIDPDREALLIETGQLALGSSDGDDGENKTMKVACSACEEQGLKQPPKFDDLAKLQRHYADKHQGLQPPDSLAA